MLNYFQKEYTLRWSKYRFKWVCYERHASTVYKVVAEVRKAAFSVRIVEPWNKLPPFVINSPSVVVFKNRLDACWETIFGSDEPQ